MRPARVRVLTAVAALVAAILAGSPGPAGAVSRHNTTYRVIELNSLGGANTGSTSINDRGLVAGWSNLAGDTSRHATVWSGRTPIDLGTLGGANSSVVWPVHNVRGQVVGISQTSTPDPRHEQWSCIDFFPAGAVSGNTCRGFVTDGDTMHALPTLGGNNGFAAGANDLGQITGWAETRWPDPTCRGRDQVLQFLPVIYGPGRDQIRALPLVRGDSSGAATAINDHGQAVGISGDCDQAEGRLTARHAVLWSHGRVLDLGTLGAGWWNTPMAINERGDVVGFTGDPSDSTGGITHAFIWTRHHGMQPLIPGDGTSTAYGINNKGQVVGTSCDRDGANCYGFIWQHGKLTNLNDAAQTGYPGNITVATDINDAGVITGRAVEPYGKVAIVARPTD